MLRRGSLIGPKWQRGAQASVSELLITGQVLPLPWRPVNLRASDANDKLEAFCQIGATSCHSFNQRWIVIVYSVTAASYVRLQVCCCLFTVRVSLPWCHSDAPLAFFLFKHELPSLTFPKWLLLFFYWTVFNSWTLHFLSRRLQFAHHTARVAILNTHNAPYKNMWHT